MKLVMYRANEGARLGALQERDGSEWIVDLNAADPQLPTDMLTFLQGGDTLRERAASAVARTTLAISSTGVRILAPLSNPGKMICIGLNYRDHAAESNLPIPEFPIVFSKYANCIVGPHEPIVLTPLTEKPDYEAELGVVIGKRARNVAEKDTLDYIAGYVPFNDVSARDYQMRTSQWTFGKIFDTFGPMGPAIVTRDEVPDPHNLNIQLSISGERLQNSNTRNLIFNLNQLIAELCSVMTLEPGDFIATGTPGGVGQSRTPPRYLKGGDVVRIEIEKLGVLENPVVAP